jgi:hypothetical protein
LNSIPKDEGLATNMFSVRQTPHPTKNKLVKVDTSMFSNISIIKHFEEDKKQEIIHFISSL